MRSVLLAPLLALLLTVNVSGDDAKAANEKRVRPAGDLMGMDVRNENNESLGHIEDLVVNIKDGSLVYAAMARGQILGFGGSLYAIAPDSLSLSANGEFLLLKAQPRDFENAKGFDQNAWPTQPDARWGNAGNNVKERDTTREQGSVKSNENLARVSKLTGLNVYGADSKMVGSLYDVAIRCSEHQIAYAAIHHGGTLGVGGTLVAVPWNALSLRTPPDQREGRAFYINATPQDFQQATGFTTDNWPSEPSARFRNLEQPGRSER